MCGWPLLVLLMLLCHAGSGTGTGRTLDSHDPVGSPGELAWQAWLLMDERADSSAEVRRITPKSVFIAPAFSPAKLPACADGYRSDSMGHCVKVVRVNQVAQMNFLLEQLNAMYGRPQPSPGSAPGTGDSNEPMQVNLPIEPDTAKRKEDTSEQQNSTDEPEPDQAPVVIADVSKRSSNNESSEEYTGNLEPVTMLPKREEVNSKDVFVPVNNETDMSQELTAFKRPLPPPTEVLAPTDVEDSLPMLVLSPGSSFSSHQESSIEVGPQSQTQNTNLNINLEQNKSNSTNGEQSAHTSSEGHDVRLPVTLDLSNVQISIIKKTAQTNKSDDEHHHISDVEPSQVHDVARPQMGNVDQPQLSDVEQTGSGEEQVTEVQEVRVPGPQILEIIDPNDQLPSATQPAYSSSYISQSYAYTTEDPYTVDRVPNRGFVRFPSEVNDDPNSFHLFKGNYIKFPKEDSFQYNKPTSRPLSQSVASLYPTREKQTYWWLQPGWRLDRQRHEPTLLRFWSRLPLRSDDSQVSQYNPSYNQQHTRHPSSHQPSFLHDWAAKFRGHVK